MTNRQSLPRSNLRISRPFRTGSAMPHAVPRPRTADERRRPRPHIIKSADQGALCDGRYHSIRQPRCTGAGNLNALSP